MALPRWRIEIHKSMGGEEWANDWLTDDDTIEDAQDLSALILTFEQHIHSTAVFFEYIRISTTLKFDRVFRHLAINQPGIDTSSDSLPLFNVYRLDMGTDDSDPCRKYFRAPVPEAAQTNGFVNGAVLTSLNGAVGTYLITPGVLPHIVSPKGHTVLTASFNARVQMRQLHRHKRKKVVTP